MLYLLVIVLLKVLIGLVQNNFKQLKLYGDLVKMLFLTQPKNVIGKLQDMAFNVISVAWRLCLPWLAMVCPGFLRYICIVYDTETFQKIIF